MIIKREWAMPNLRTFQIKPIKNIRLIKIEAIEGITNEAAIHNNTRAIEKPHAQ